MAEITTKSSQKKSLRTQCAKRSTRVDLTPMVDLGFILITFFIFTSTLASPTTMNLLLPNDTGSTNDEICASCAVTFILAGNNRLYYYEGREENAVYKQTNYSFGGIRQLISNKKKLVKHAMPGDRLVVIIKPGPNSSFRNLINVIDECNINLVKRYYIDAISPREASVL